MSLRLTGWLLVVVVVASIAAYAAGVINLQLLETTLALIGVGGLAGLRTLINSSGYKTYIVSIGGAIVTALYGFGIISQEVFGVLLVSVLGLAVPALGHAVSKANALK